MPAPGCAGGYDVDAMGYCWYCGPTCYVTCPSVPPRLALLRLGAGITAPPFVPAARSPAAHLAHRAHHYAPRRWSSYYPIFISLPPNDLNISGDVHTSDVSQPSMCAAPSPPRLRLGGWRRPSPALTERLAKFQPATLGSPSNTPAAAHRCCAAQDQGRPARRAHRPGGPRPTALQGWPRVGRADALPGRRPRRRRLAAGRHPPHRVVQRLIPHHPVPWHAQHHRRVKMMNFVS